MSTKTTNYELVKPELTDVADITAMNPNWDKLDENLKNINDTIGEKYVKPSSGIPKTDFTSEVQESLAKANSAIQVEEMGNSGIWTYVKYSNGIAECWGVYSGKASLSNTLDGAYYCDRIDVNYPFTFASAPVYTVSGGSNNHMNWARRFAQTLTDKATFIAVGLKAQTNVDIHVHIHAIGKWK